MAVLDWKGPDRGLQLTGEGVRLRPPRMTDYPAWSELRLRSREFLQPWEPTWPSDDLTRSAFRRRLAAYSRDIDLDQAYPFFIFRATHTNSHAFHPSAERSTSAHGCVSWEYTARRG